MRAVIASSGAVACRRGAGGHQPVERVSQAVEVTKAGRRQGLILLAVCFGLFIIQLDLSIVNVALPKIEGDLGSGVSGLQWVVDAYALVLASLLLTGGALGDRFGRKRLFLIGLTIFALGSALCGLAPSLGVLIAGRAIQGVGAALQLPTSLSLLTATFTNPSERARALGIWASVAGSAFIAGPVLGGILVDGVGWWSVFLVNVPITLFAIAVTWRVVPESADPAARRLDLPGQLLSIVSLATLVFGVIEGNSRGWGSLPIVGAFAVAAIGGTLFLLVESRRASPLLPLGFFRDATFAASNAIAIVFVFMILGLLFIFTLFLQQIWGASAIGAGLRLLPISVAFVVAGTLGGRLAARFGPRAPVTFAAIATGVGFLLLTLIDAETSYLAMIPVMILIGFGGGIGQPAVIAAALSGMPVERAGITSGMINTSRQAGGAIGVATLGTLLATRMRGDLDRTLTALGVPLGDRDRIVGAAVHGERVTGGVLPAGFDPGAVQRAVETAFVSGMHLAALVGGLALLGGAVVACAGIRPRGKATVADGGEVRYVGTESEEVAAD